MGKITQTEGTVKMTLNLEIIEYPDHWQIKKEGAVPFDVLKDGTLEVRIPRKLHLKISKGDSNEDG